MSKPIYSAIFLSENSKQRLLREFPPAHSKVYAHHVTLMFKPTPEHLASLEFGKHVKIEVIGYAEDARGQAAAVRLPPGVECNNINSHITISTTESWSPAYSNQLLAGGITTVPSFLLEGIIGTA